jgi:hypothetical protein
MHAVAKALLGEPNKHHSKAGELRYGSHGSLSVDLRKGTYHDHEAKVGGGVLDLVRRVKGFDNGEAIKWLRDEGILEAEASSREEKFIEAAYDYTDEHGKLIFQAVRYGYRRGGSRIFADDGKPKKSFAQRRPDGSSWVWNLKDVRPVPYRLPQLIEAIADDKQIFIAEGEKCVDRLIAAGLAATCNAAGAGKWPNELTKHFAGAKVVILRDNDEAGRNHGALVAEKLQGTAESIVILDLPDLREKEDVVNWLEAGHTAAELQELVATNGRLPGEGLQHGAESRAPRIGFSAAELAEMRFPEVKYVVPGYVAEGLTLLAGKPKIGKSWLTLHFAIADATGGSSLGSDPCEQGDVLYCALEDTKRRLQRRMAKLTGSAFGPWPERLTFTCDMPRLKVGGLDYIRKWISQSAKPRLCIVDTLAKVREPKGRDQSLYEADYEAISALKKIADEAGIAIVVVHHVSKRDAEDPLDALSGTTGLTGAADSVLVLTRNTQSTVLYGRGRDIEEIEKAVTFDRETCLWQVVGDADDVRRSGTRMAILKALRAAPEPLSPADIAAVTDIKVGTVRATLIRMVQDGDLEKAERGRYRASRT